jgi:rubrerythrin
MNLEQAIKTAIEYEKRVRDVYVEAFDETSTEEGKRIFQLLADEEHGHVLFLEAKLSQWVTWQRISLDELDTALPPVDEIKKAVEKLQDTLIGDKQEKELSLLRKALELETETSAFYKQMVSELLPQGQELFSRFVSIENGHLSLVEAEIDYLEHKGSWLAVSDGELKYL